MISFILFLIIGVKLNLMNNWWYILFLALKLIWVIFKFCVTLIQMGMED